jgi:hypothetical protein
MDHTKTATKNMGFLATTDIIVSPAFHFYSGINKNAKYKLWIKQPTKDNNT